MTAPSVLPAASLERLFRALTDRGYDCVGPTVRDGAIVYDHVQGPTDLPIGWRDVHAAGEYRLERRDDDAYFGYNMGPHSFKKFLFPPEQRLWRLRRRDGTFELVEDGESTPRYAFFGVRACELAALNIQDRVFFGGRFTDHRYRRAREAAFVVAVSCTQSTSTCFCTSMGTGPEVRGDCDLSLTEVLAPEHVLLIRAYSDRGEDVLSELGLRDATDAQQAAARAGIADAARQERAMDDAGSVPALMRESFTSTHWAEVAERCLSCANCTLVCPTCFCSDVEDVTDLTGEHAERWRRWDSCFDREFSYLAGGEVRKSIASRYRQWLTHKLGSWVDQFGSSGCVGCGRCIAWCPVGIDLTEEVRALRARNAGGPDSVSSGQGPSPSSSAPRISAPHGSEGP